MDARQLTLPTIEASHRKPTPPMPNTLAAALLQCLAAGRSVNHIEWLSISGSWRCAASAQELRDLGWPVVKIPEHAPTISNPRRYIARYFLGEVCA